MTPGSITFDNKHAPAIIVENKMIEVTTEWTHTVTEWTALLLLRESGTLITHLVPKLEETTRITRRSAMFSVPEVVCVC